jgi:hypothetical protein
MTALLTRLSGPIGLVLVVLAVWFAPLSAHARGTGDAGGRPKVVLDRLEFPKTLPDASHFERHLRQVLRREARRAEWGAGQGSRIEFRYAVTTLEVSEQGGVLRVRCAAVGKLPGNKSAKSSLSFGGDPRKRREAIQRVLEIVARGVITRLAEIERIRRGQLESARVRAPALSD